MKALHLAVATMLADAFTGSAPAHAQYPDKPIRMIVGFVAGGFTDVLARTVAQSLQERLG